MNGDIAEQCRAAQCAYSTETTRQQYKNEAVNLKRFFTCLIDSTRCFRQDVRPTGGGATKHTVLHDRRVYTGRTDRILFRFRIKRQKLRSDCGRALGIQRAQRSNTGQWFGPQSAPKVLRRGVVRESPQLLCERAELLSVLLRDRQHRVIIR